MNITSNDGTSQGSEEGNREQWYYLFKDQTYGPKTVDEIRSFLRAGAIPTSTFVFCEGMKDWAKADSLKEFQISNDAGSKPMNEIKGAKTSSPEKPSAEGISHTPLKQGNVSITPILVPKRRIAGIVIVCAAVLLIGGIITTFQVVQKRKVEKAAAAARQQKQEEAARLAATARAEQAARSAREKAEQAEIERKRLEAETERKQYESDGNIPWDIAREIKTTRKGKYDSVIESTWRIKPINSNYFRITQMVNVFSERFDKRSTLLNLLSRDHSTDLLFPDVAEQEALLLKQLRQRAIRPEVLREELERDESLTAYREYVEKTIVVEFNDVGFSFLRNQIEALKGLFTKYSEWREVAEKENLSPELEKQIGSFPQAELQYHYDHFKRTDTGYSTYQIPATFITPQSMKFSGCLMDSKDVQSCLTLIAMIPDMDKAIAKSTSDMSASEKADREKLERETQQLLKEKARVDSALKN